MPETENKPKNSKLHRTVTSLLWTKTGNDRRRLLALLIEPWQVHRQTTSSPSKAESRRRKRPTTAVRQRFTRAVSKHQTSPSSSPNLLLLVQQTPVAVPVPVGVPSVAAAAVAVDVVTATNGNASNNNNNCNDGAVILLAAGRSNNGHRHRPWWSAVASVVVVVEGYSEGPAVATVPALVLWRQPTW